MMSLYTIICIICFLVKNILNVLADLKKRLDTQIEPNTVVIDRRTCTTLEIHVLLKYLYDILINDLRSKNLHYLPLLHVKITPYTYCHTDKYS